MTDENERLVNWKGFSAGSMAVGAALLAAFLTGTSPASAQAAWTAVEDKAQATLPSPEPGSPVTAGVLFCEAQVWTLTLGLEADAEIDGANGIAKLTAHGETFDVESSASRGAIDITVPYLALEPMMASNRMQIAFTGEKNPVRFPLAGSRRAITAVQGLCSPRELPDMNSVELTPASPYIELGRQLREDDIRDFVISTASLPDLRARMLELGGDRRLLFVEMCGSSWYFGVSGCSVAGFARNSPEDEGASSAEDGVDTEGWEPVFESEGAYLYLDPAGKADGWPDIATIPLKPGSPDQNWVWDGERYAMTSPVAAEIEPED